MELTTEQLEVAKGLGIDVSDVKTLDELKAKAGEKFIDRSLHTEQLDKKQKELDKSWADSRVEGEKKLKTILGDEAKGKKFDEMVDLLLAKDQERESRIKELESKTTTTGKEKQELEDLKKEKQQTDDLLKQANDKIGTLTKEVESAKADGETRESQILLNLAVNKDFDTLPWSDQANEFTRDGFWRKKVEGVVTFKEDNKVVYVYDMEGDIIPDGTGKKTAKKYFTEEAEKAGLLKKNGAKNEPVITGASTENMKPFELRHAQMKAKLKEAQSKASGK
jgi:hypothetical protein